MEYDRIKDEYKSLTMAEFTEIMTEMLADYRRILEHRNPWVTANHTFDEWLAAFGRFISW